MPTYLVTLERKRIVIEECFVEVDAQTSRDASDQARDLADDWNAISDTVEYDLVVDVDLV